MCIIIGVCSQSFLPSEVFGHSNEGRLGGAGGLVASLKTAEWRLIYGLRRAASALTNLSLLIWVSVKSKSNWGFYRRAFSFLQHRSIQLYYYSYLGLATFCFFVLMFLCCGVHQRLVAQRLPSDFLCSAAGLSLGTTKANARVKLISLSRHPQIWLLEMRSQYASVYLFWWWPINKYWTLLVISVSEKQAWKLFNKAVIDECSCMYLMERGARLC